MFIYYITSEKKALYKIKRNKVLPSTLKILKNPLSFFQKRVLVLGKEWVYFSKKRYPLLPEKELKKAISYDIPELFPLREPSYLFFIGKRGETFLEVNLFAWEKTLAEEIKKDFSFGYLVPEELLFLYDEPTLSILKKGEKALIVLSQNRTFLNSLLIKTPFSPDEVFLFLKSAGLEISEIKKVLVYGFSQRDFMVFIPSELKSKILLKTSLEKDFPFLLKSLNLKFFKLKEEVFLNLEEWLLRCARLFLMAVIALQLNLIFSSWEYNRNIKNLRDELKKIDEKMKKERYLTQRDSSKAVQDQEKLQALKELKEELYFHKENSVSDGLLILAEVARLLPYGAKLNSFSLKEKKLILNLEAKDLFEVLTNFKKSPYFSNLKLSSAPLVDPKKKNYRFSLECEVK